MTTQNKGTTRVWDPKKKCFIDVDMPPCICGVQLLPDERTEQHSLPLKEDMKSGGKEMNAYEKLFNVTFVPGYDDLFWVLMDAYDRASKGKGHQRHSRGEPFNQQWILRGSRRFGAGSLNYQIGKKNEEIESLETTEAKIKELLDIMVYAAAEIILLREVSNISANPET